MQQARQRIGRKFRFLTIAILSLGLAACASTQTRVNNAGAFATAGITYVDALPALLDESFELAVSANSISLILSREGFDISPEDFEGLSEDQRQELVVQRENDLMDQLAKANKRLTERQSILNDFRQHALLLRSYFIALKALSASENATGITEMTNGLVASLGQLHPEIASASIGDANPSDFIGPAVNLVVGAYQNDVIKRELEAHGDAIANELNLQRATVTALVEDMRANAEYEIQVKELNPVFMQFVREGKIPDDWSDRRIAAFRKSVELNNLDAVKTAAANLQANWVALVENRVTDNAMMLLLQDVEQMLALAQKIRAES